MILIKEINDLRRVLRSTRDYAKELEGSLGITSKKKLHGGAELAEMRSAKSSQ